MNIAQFFFLVRRRPSGWTAGGAQPTAVLLAALIYKSRRRPRTSLRKPPRRPFVARPADGDGRTKLCSRVHSVRSQHVFFMSTSNVVLEQVRLLHDSQELFLVNLAVTITVRFVDHLLQLLVRHPLPKLLRDALEVLERDLSGLVVIEEPERLEDLVLRVTVKDLLRHHRHELRKFDGPRPIIVDVLDHLLDLLLLRLEAKSAHGDLELLRVDGAGTVSVEQVKGFLDLLLLLLSELLLLAATAAETTTQRHRRSRLFC